MLRRIAQATLQGMRGPGYGNIHEGERVASLLVGVGCLGLAGMRWSLVRRASLAGLGAVLVWRGVTGHSALYRALGLNTSRPSNVERAGSDRVSSMPHRQGVHVHSQIEIRKSPHEVFEFWKRLENLPQFMEHLESVQRTGPERSHWVARAPLGQTVAWDAQIIAEDQDRRISWRSLEGSEIANAGTVLFESTGAPNTTLLKVHLKYNPPAGKVGAALASLLGEAPSQQLDQDLARLRDLLESRPSSRPYRPAGTVGPA